MDWQRLFPAKILDRGYDYYLDDLVDDLRLNKDTLTATVQGSEDYSVRILFKNDSISEMDCTCPYAEDGSNCKHMAAVLFQWNDEKDDNDDDILTDNDSSDDSETDNSVTSLVTAADSEVIKSFLIQVLENDEKLLLRFKSMVVPGVSAEDMQKYKAQINRAVKSYTGRHGFIEYSSADSFTHAMSEFLVEVVGVMTDNENYREAFELTCHVFLTVADVEMDDSDGGRGELASKCCDIWLDILQNVDINAKTLMFNWFTDQLSGSVVDYMEEYIEDIIMDEFTERDFYNAKLAFADKKVLDSRGSLDSWSNHFQHGRWARYRLALMESSHCDWSDLERYCSEQWVSSEVRKYYVEKCLEKQDYNRAIEVLEESVFLDSEYRGLVSEYSMKLKELYKRTGNTERYREQLWQLVLNHHVGDLEVYRELKALYPEEEWVEQRETVFKAPDWRYSIDDLYKEEGLNDRLLDYVLRSSGLNIAKKHLNTLKKLYPKQLLQKYRTEVEAMAKHVSDRNRYREMVSILRAMNSIEGGSDIVSEIARNWRFDYRNRRAMMDELSKL